MIVWVFSLSQGPMSVPKKMVAVSNSVFIEEIPGEPVPVPMAIWLRMELLV